MRIIISVLLLAVLLPAGALDLTFNGSPVEATLQKAAELGYLDRGVPTVSLGDLLPLTYGTSSVHVIDGREQSRRFTTENLFQVELRFPDTGVILVAPDGEFLETREVMVTSNELDLRPIEVWVSWESTDLLKAEAERFSRRYHMPVTIRDVPGISRRITAYERSGQQMPDVVMVQADYIPELLAHRILQPVRRDGSDAFTLEGDQWAVPFSLDTHIAVYNPDQLNLPDRDYTLEELFRGITDTGIPASWNVYSFYWLLPMLYHAADAPFPDPHTVQIDSPEAAAAICQLLTWMSEGVLLPRERDGMIDGFLRGEVSYMLTGSYMLGLLDKLGIAYEAAVYPIDMTPLLDWKGFSVTRRSLNPAGARAFIDYFTSPAVQRNLPAAMGKLPADSRALSFAAENIQHGQVLLDSRLRGVPVPAGSSYAVTKDVMWGMLRLMLHRSVSPSDGLVRAQGMIERRLSDAALREGL